ncbi:hypothetical protein ACFQJD_18255 [Haloplanus sp. GCM10025708]|uniref:DUF7511 domain-containing protein n=1 Tax=Haloferacaceae TaxID=1644056 RepID=UPI003621BADC
MERSDERAANEIRVADESLTEWPTFDVRYAVEVEDDEPDRCTMYPADAADEDQMTTWITAEQGSYVSVVSRR